MKKEDKKLQIDVPAKSSEDDALRKNNLLIKYKILVDKLGAGFSSIQFLNILFSFTGASIFMIGVVNALKSAINTLTSSVVKKQAEKGHFSTDLMIVSGIFFGFSFLFIALGISLKWKWLFALSLLLGSAFFVIHGDMFQIFLNKYLKKLKPGLFTEKTTFIGILVMAFALFLSAWLMESISFSGKSFTFPIIGTSIYFGYLISFEIAAFAFIFSSYLFMRIKITLVSFNEQDSGEFKGYFEELIENSKKYFKNKYLFTLTLATIFVGVFQAIMNAFVGIHIYNDYGNVFLGGFLNVGFMLSLVLLVVLIGPTITGKMNRNLGVAPLFVFGTLLMAILPLTLYYNSYFPAVVVANMLSVLGAAMIGSGHNLVSLRLLNEKDRESYYTFSGIIALIPFIIFVVLLSLFANMYGFLQLFKYMGFGVVACLFPIYFLIVIWISKTSNLEKKSI
jgi:hypothetical protein